MPVTPSTGQYIENLKARARDAAGVLTGKLEELLAKIRSGVDDEADKLKVELDDAHDAFNAILAEPTPNHLVDPSPATPKEVKQVEPLPSSSTSSESSSSTSSSTPPPASEGEKTAINPGGS